MIRLHIVVEGETEKEFVDEILKPAFSERMIILDARCVATSRKGGRKHSGGGISRSYIRLKNDLMNWIKEDRKADARFSMMIDFYKLAPDFPGYKESRQQNTVQNKVKILEKRFFEEINDYRFIPYIQLHEFEALLFAEPEKFAIAYPNRQNKIQQLIKIRAQFESPEEINEGSTTAPSKRIKAILPEYEKRTAGPLIALEIGIEKLCEENSHFNEWIEKIKQLV
ncbi:MAG TPA: DUF4276 family protein [Thiotrichaceae bacterium]|nr:DUF4276 family protein [Thiotrichaceae bacterium]